MSYFNNIKNTKVNGPLLITDEVGSGGLQADFHCTRNGAFDGTMTAGRIQTSLLNPQGVTFLAPPTVVLPNFGQPGSISNGGLLVMGEDITDDITLTLPTPTEGYLLFFVNQSFKRILFTNEVRYEGPIGTSSLNTSASVSATSQAMLISDGVIWRVFYDSSLLSELVGAILLLESLQANLIYDPVADSFTTTAKWEFPKKVTVVNSAGGATSDEGLRFEDGTTSILMDNHNGELRLSSGLLINGPNALELRNPDTNHSAFIYNENNECIVEGGVLSTAAGVKITNNVNSYTNGLKLTDGTSTAFLALKSDKLCVSHNSHFDQGVEVVGAFSTSGGVLITNTPASYMNGLAITDGTYVANIAVRAMPGDSANLWIDRLTVFPSGLRTTSTIYAETGGVRVANTSGTYDGLALTDGFSTAKMCIGAGRLKFDTPSTFVGGLQLDNGLNITNAGANVTGGVIVNNTAGSFNGGIWLTDLSTGTGKLAFKTAKLHADTDMVFDAGLTVDSVAGVFNAGITANNTAATFNAGISLPNSTGGATGTQGLRFHEGSFNILVDSYNGVLQTSSGFRINSPNKLVFADSATSTQTLVENSNGSLKLSGGQVLTTHGAKIVNNSGSYFNGLQISDGSTTASMAMIAGLLSFNTSGYFQQGLTTDNTLTANVGGLVVRNQTGSYADGLWLTESYASTVKLSVQSGVLRVNEDTAFDKSVSTTTGMFVNNTPSSYTGGLWITDNSTGTAKLSMQSGKLKINEDVVMDKALTVTTTLTCSGALSFPDASISPSWISGGITPKAAGRVQFKKFTDNSFDTGTLPLNPLLTYYQVSDGFGMDATSPITYETAPSGIYAVRLKFAAHSTSGVLVVTLQHPQPEDTKGWTTYAMPYNDTLSATYFWYVYVYSGGTSPSGGKYCSFSFIFY